MGGCVCKGNNINIIKTKKNNELNKNCHYLNNDKFEIHSQLSNELNMSSHSLHSTDISEILNKTNIIDDEKDPIGNDPFKEILELFDE